MLLKNEDVKLREMETVRAAVQCADKQYNQCCVRFIWLVRCDTDWKVPRLLRQFEALVQKGPCDRDPLPPSLRLPLPATAVVLLHRRSVTSTAVVRRRGAAVAPPGLHLRPHSRRIPARRPLCRLPRRPKRHATPRLASPRRPA